MPNFPASIDTDTSLYLAVNNTATTVTSPVGAGDTTINVASTAAFPATGFFTLDLEAISYTGKTATSFTGCGRGADGTSATSHITGTVAFHQVMAAHHNQLKDATIAVQQYLIDRFGLTSNLVVPSPKSLSLQTLTNQLIFGTTNTITINAPAPAAPRIYTIPDAGSGAAFIMDAGTQTLTGLTTFSQLLTANTIANASGSASAPGYFFTDDPNSGLARLGADNIALCVNGKEVVNVTTENDFRLQRTESGATFTIRAYNTANTAGTAANFIAGVGGSSAGDSWYSALITGGGEWSWGVDNSDSDRFKLSHSSVLGTNDRLVADLTNGVSFQGTATNDNAPTGWVGEYLTSTVGNTPSPGTGQWFDLTSLSLTAGDWEVEIIAANNSTNYAACTDISFGIGTTAGNTSPGATQMLDFISMSWAGGHLGKINQNLTKRFSISATTTVYAKANMTFTAGTQNGLCQLRARRVR